MRVVAMAERTARESAVRVMAMAERTTGESTVRLVAMAVPAFSVRAARSG